MLKISECELCKKSYRTGILRLVERKWVECGKGVGRTRFGADKLLVCKNCYSVLKSGNGVVSKDIVWGRQEEPLPLFLDESSVEDAPKKERKKREKRDILADTIADRYVTEAVVNSVSNSILKDEIRGIYKTTLYEDIAEELGITLEEVQSICAELDRESK